MQVVKPREEYIMVIDSDCILRKPFIPEELHLELGKSHCYLGNQCLGDRT